MESTHPPALGHGHSHSHSHRHATLMPEQPSPSSPSAATISTALARLGYSSLRGLQRPALESVYARQDCVVLLPTGGGKSLCFQLPAVMLRGLVIVVSPLLALMQDQVQALRQRGVRVEMLCSLVNSNEQRRIRDNLLRHAIARDRPSSSGFLASAPVAGAIELLYTTPETLRTFAVQELLGTLHEHGALTLFAIDEAHCISAWGHDFRPAYLELAALRDRFPAVPVMALTATATHEVSADIRNLLKLRADARVLRGDFNRANITYTVCIKDTLRDPASALSQFITKCHPRAAGIIYVHRRIDTESLASSLLKRDPSLLIAPYHARLTLKVREQTLLDWLRGKIHVIVATIAFGMGIDHPAVRFVVHWSMPKTYENLYQEAGRAGRDGLPSRAILLYSAQDYSFFQYWTDQAIVKLMENKAKLGSAEIQMRRRKLERTMEHVRKVQQYATQHRCRRQAMLSHFGQELTTAECNGTCDVCNPQLAFEVLIRPATDAGSGSGAQVAGVKRERSTQQSAIDLSGTGPMFCVDSFRAKQRRIQSLFGSSNAHDVVCIDDDSECEELPRPCAPEIISLVDDDSEEEDKAQVIVDVDADDGDDGFDY